MCRSIETNSKIVREHNGRSVTVSNASYKEIAVVQVDGCLINDSSKRCDWLFEIPIGKKLVSGVEAVKLVELKGSNVSKAFAQLESTLGHAAIASIRSLVDHCFIASKVSPSLNTTVQIEKQRFMQTYGLQVTVKTKVEFSAG